MTTRRDLLRAAAGGILTLAAIDSLPILPDEPTEADALEGARHRPPTDHALVAFEYHSGAERWETIGLHGELGPPCSVCTVRSIKFDWPPPMFDHSWYLESPRPLELEPIEVTIVHLNGRREQFTMDDIAKGTLYT